MDIEFRADSARYWDFFAGEAASLEAPLYARFAQGVRDDADLRALAAHVQPGQPPANTLFAAVHYLLLRGAEHELRNFYPNLSNNIPPGDPYPAFREFCLDHADEIARLLATRVTNTNEVARAALLYPAFVTLAREAPQPFHVIEIGPSAGLNLYWDRYGYRYLRNGEAFVGGAEGAELVIEMPLRGDQVPPRGPVPRVEKRIGLERSPVDLCNPDDRDWLKALVWPDHEQRFRRLECALALNASWPHDIRKGDALALLPAVLGEMPENETLCIYHTITLYQFGAEKRAAFNDMLLALSARRPFYVISVERVHQGDFPLVLTHYEDAGSLARTLALCGPQGSWLEWRG